ncbi:Hsp70 family protein [Streptomyces fradiae]|uniref:Hsp70 family protein n=1 Tax=Streptomyces fradiae TaxID=1906 RepID=UPI0036480604
MSREERNRWRRDVELTKISLSRRDLLEVPLGIPALGKPLTISRNEYTTAAAPLIERAMEPLTQCLRDTGIAPASVDAVLMIGGTSQIPEARDAIANAFGADRIIPPELCDPMTAVARGAAVYSAALDDPDHKDRFSLVTNYDLGTAFAAGPRKGFQPVIHRNRTLAATGERRFIPSRPYASSVAVEIIEGEQGYPADSDRAFPLARLEVRLRGPSRIPSAMPYSSDSSMITAGSSLSRLHTRKPSAFSSAARSIPSERTERPFRKACKESWPGSSPTWMFH